MISHSGNVYDVYIFYLPHWFIWAAGLLPFALATVARWRHFEQLWWVSTTIIAGFIIGGIVFMLYTHQWLRLGLVLTGLSLSCLLWAYGCSRRRRPPRHGPV
jgi:hypothetical protein